MARKEGRRKCSGHMMPVFYKDGVIVHGRGQWAGLSPWEADIFIDLLGTQAASPDWKLPPHFQAAQLVRAPMVLRMPFSDQSAPPVCPEFWRALWADLVKEAAGRPNGALVLVGCQGGHGRTGTVLVCLAWAAGVLGSDPVAWVRDNYCPEAVESAAQVAYIEKVTGLKVKEKLDDTAAGPSAGSQWLWGTGTKLWE